MSLSKETKSVYRDILMEKRIAIMGTLKKASESIAREEDIPADAVDLAANTEDRILSMQIKGREEQELIEINNALRRLETNEFGSCQNCDELITDARLRAYPLATLCIDCKATLEFKQRGQIQRSSLSTTEL